MSTRKPRITSLGTLISAAILALAMPAWDGFSGQAEDGFFEGKAFWRQLASPLGGSWSGVPLVEVTAGLSRTQNVAISLDRRIDPGRPVSLEVSDRPLVEVLDELARGQNLDIFLLGPVVCLTPRGEAARLEAAAQSRRHEVRRRPAAVGRKWRSKGPLAWDDLSAPAELLTDLSRQGGFTIVNPRRLPHDLWAAGNLPRLSLSDRLSFILGQFGLTYEMSAEAEAIRLVPIPDMPVPAGDYPAAKGSHRLKSLAKKHKKQTPVAGRSEIRIEKFSVSEVQLEPLLDQLASRLGLTLKLDREAIRSAGIRLDQRVSISATGVTPDELFEKILGPLGLSARRNGKKITIGPSKSSENQPRMNTDKHGTNSSRVFRVFLVACRP